MVSSTSLTSLAEKINQCIFQKLALLQQSQVAMEELFWKVKMAEDIKLYNFDFDNKSGKTISTRLTDRFSKPLGNEVLLGSTTGGTAGVAKSLQFQGSFLQIIKQLFLFLREVLLLIQLMVVKLQLKQEIVCLLIQDQVNSRALMVKQLKKYHLVFCKCLIRMENNYLKLKVTEPQMD